MGDGLNWGLLGGPVGDNVFASFQQGKAVRRQNDVQNAFAKYGSDPKGAVAAAMAADPDAGMKLSAYDADQQERGGKIRGAQALAARDYEGAATAFGEAGDAQGVAASQNAQVADFTRQHDYMRKVLPSLTNFASKGGDVAGAFETLAPNLRQLGVKDDALEAMRTQFKADPKAALAGLSATAQADYEYLKLGDEVVVVNKTTNQEVGRFSGSKFIALAPDQNLYQVGGNGAQPASGGGSGVEMQSQPAATRAPSGGMYDQVAQIAQANGASAEDIPYLQRLAQVESNANPNARNGSSTGIFQFQPDTFRSVGGGDINSVADQTKAALALARRDRAKLQEMGVPVTDANLYIMHQQGPGGGPALLTAPPEVNAVAALTPAYGGNAARARQAIVGNGGREDMSAGEFVNYWQNRWGGAGQGGPRPAPTQMAQAVPGAGVPAGARLVAQGAPKAPDWQEMTPAESARYGQGVWLKNKNGDVKPAVAAPSGRKSWSAALTAQQTDDISAIQTASSLNSTLKNALGQIESGRLNLGLMSNMAATGLNTVGMGNANTRNYASFKANLEKLRNDSLRLNKGVQTDGDAQRAWNELMANINDEGVVKQRLAEIMDLNERAVLFRSETINQRREDAGLPALDPSKFRYGSRPQAAPASVQRHAAATSRPAPAKPVVRPGTVDSGYRFKGGDPANPRNWEKL